ncbi:hypothetical protein DFJ74DRAFT_328699 [Hyaloraphidium curvatum]|nr:hypothetical protein DFJ74DRAFT_328699 [Hyaloraphidium curvatum]
MSSWSLSALKQFADQVQDGASKLAETAKEGLNQAASALDEQLKATASLAASKVPTAAPIDGPPAVAAELATGPTASPAPSAVNSRPVSPVQRGPEEPATRTVDDSAFNGVRKSSEVKAASFGDLQMENTALRDQLHDALSQMASLQTKLKDTTGQLDLVKQKARVKLASLTKEVEELKKRGPDAASPASPGQGSPLSHVGDGASQDTRIPELEALVASRAAELESERRRAEAAEEKLSTLQRGMEAQADSDRAAADADRASSRVRVTELESQLAESEPDGRPTSCQGHGGPGAPRTLA